MKTQQHKHDRDENTTITDYCTDYRMQTLFSNDSRLVIGASPSRLSNRQMSRTSNTQYETSTYALYLDLVALASFFSFADIPNRCVLRFDTIRCLVQQSALYPHTLVLILILVALRNIALVACIMERVGRADGVRTVSAFECMGCGREKIDMDGGGQMSGRKDGLRAS